MALTNPQFETLTWVFIYSGLLLVCLGLFVWRADQSLLGAGLVAAGAADAAAGVVMLWLRSKRPDAPR